MKLDFFSEIRPYVGRPAGKKGDDRPYDQIFVCGEDVSFSLSPIMPKRKACHPSVERERVFSLNGLNFFAEFDFSNLPLDVLRQPIATMVILKPSALNQHNQDTH